LFGQIDGNEDITGKKRLQGLPQPARVSNGAPQSRKEASEPQPMEIELRPALLMRERSRDKPSLSWPQFQITGQTFAPKLPSHFFLYLDAPILWESYAPERSDPSHVIQKYCG
jgi:hypothetical protein